MPRISLTTEEFIQRAKKVHNNKYDYSLVDYKRSNEKIQIICPKHGIFLQTANEHFRGFGCQQCGKENQAKKIASNAAKFIQKAKEVHNNKYDYSLVEYKGVKKNVKIICPIHGSFLQIPDSHLNGSGCQKCGRILLQNKRRHTTEKFIQKAKEIHGNKYDYSLVEYKRSTEKVFIICQFHGEFLQSPRQHLSGHGCPKCRYSVIATENTNILWTTKSFIEKAKEVHNNKYDYSLVDYKYSHQKVKIICPIHGLFLQDPNSHLKGHGCPKCGIEARNKTRKINKELKEKE